MKKFKLMSVAAIAGILLLSVVFSCSNENRNSGNSISSVISESKEIQKRIGGQSDNIYELYELKIDSLSLEIKSLKKELAISENWVKYYKNSTEEYHKFCVRYQLKLSEELKQYSR